MNYRPEVAEQIADIRERVAKGGEAVVKCDQLSILCPEVDPARRLRQIENIARWEKWGFQLLPYGAVRFFPADGA